MCRKTKIRVELLVQHVAPSFAPLHFMTSMEFGADPQLGPVGMRVKAHSGSDPNDSTFGPPGRAAPTPTPAQHWTCCLRSPCTCLIRRIRPLCDRGTTKTTKKNVSLSSQWSFLSLSLSSLPRGLWKWKYWLRRGRGKRARGHPESVPFLINTLFEQAHKKIPHYCAGPVEPGRRAGSSPDARQQRDR